MNVRHVVRNAEALELSSFVVVIHGLERDFIGSSTVGTVKVPHVNAA